MTRIGLVSDTNATPAQLATAGATDGQSLVYHAATGLWIPQTITAGGGGITSVFGRSTPAIAAASGDYSLSQISNVPFLAVYPTGDTTGNNDYTNINNALTAMAAVGGEVWLLGGSFYTNTMVTVPTNVLLRGCGWPHLFGVGAVSSSLTTPAVVFCHRTSNYSGSPPDRIPPCGVDGIIIDGVNCTGKTRGIDTGDGEGLHIRVAVQNFIHGTTGDSAGAFLINRYFFTEKSVFRIWAYNNDNACWITFTGATGGDSSWEYNELWLKMISPVGSPNQNGLVIQNVSTGGSFINIMGDMPPTSASSGAPANNGGTGLPTALITLWSGSSTTRMWQTTINARVESSGGGGVNPYTIVSDGIAYVRDCHGRITTGMNGIKMGGAECTFSGMLGPNEYPSGTSPGLSDLGYVTTVPASGATWTNTGPDCLVRLSGGTISAVSKNGVNVPGVAASHYEMRANETLTPTYTGTLVMTIIPMVSQN